MKAFIVSALLGLAAADVAHHASIAVGGVAHTTGHFAPHHGPAVVAHAAPVLSHAVHAAPVVAHHAPVLSHAVHAPVVAHPVAHAVHHAAPVVAHHAVAHHAPVVAHAVHAPVHHAVHPVAHAVHAAPVVAHHSPVVAHAVHAAPVIAHAAPAYHAPAEVYPDEVSPYTYTYAVADDYSKANFDASETSDGASNVQGSYSVALPDGRIQHVTYSSNGYDGYVADVTYDGTAQYPEAPAPYHAPAPAYHA
jgi:hypothetical protein